MFAGFEPRAICGSPQEIRIGRSSFPPIPKPNARRMGFAPWLVRFVERVRAASIATAAAR
jgi:hypothetical protein